MVRDPASGTPDVRCGCPCSVFPDGESRAVEAAANGVPYHLSVQPAPDHCRLPTGELLMSLFVETSTTI